MSDDLHARLLSAVRQRMETAQAVNGTEWPRWWSNEGGVVGLRAETNAFIAANGPATIIRHCVVDLELLALHAPRDDGYHWCYLGADFGLLTVRPVECPVHRFLAVAYEVSADG